MSRKLMSGLAVAAALCMAAPVWAQGGHGQGRGNGYGHSNGNGYGHGNGHRYGHQGHRYHGHERYVVREFVRPVPVYPRAFYPAYPAAAPGIQVVLPSIFIPFFH